MSSMHAYETLSLATVGVVLGICLVAVHLVMLLVPAPVQRFLQTFHRQQQLGTVLLTLGMAWFWLLVAQPGPGFLHALAMDLGEFNNAKPILKLLVPATFFAVALTMKEFLSVRALGVLALLVAAPLLDAAFLKDPASRLLVPIFAYALIIAGLFWVGMPYTFRDAATWATAKPSRWRLLSLAGLAYGIAVLGCALSVWRGY
jgi:hypothetical protein